MSITPDHADQKVEALPESDGASKLRSDGSESSKTLKVSNVSESASEQDVREFFSFSGDVEYVEMRSESETAIVAYVTLKELQAADTAMLLSGATISGSAVTIEPAKDYQLPPDAPSSNSDQKSAAFKKAEDVVSTMIAKGYVLGKDALKKAKSFDERMQLTSNASATVASIDQKIGLSQKLSKGTSAVNEKFQVYERTKSAITAAEQKASSAGSAILSNQYVSAGATWVSDTFSKVAKAAEVVGAMTKEKVGKAEEEKKEGLVNVQDKTTKDVGSKETDVSPAPATVPAGEPATVPAGEPATVPTGEPATVPAGEPATVPAGESATVPAGEPATVPTVEPARAPAASTETKL